MQHPTSLTPFQRIFIAFDKYGEYQEPITKFTDLQELVEPLLALNVGLKIRLPLILRFGADALRSIGLYGPRLFVDIKTHDIGPSSADDYQAITEAFNPGYISCHLSSSRRMLKRLGAHQSVGNSPHLVGVSILTDIEEMDCINIYDAKPPEMVERLVARGKHEGINHIVCSAQEVERVRKAQPLFTLFTPGLIFGEAENNDQARVGAVKNAVIAGADFLIFGTSITCAANPVDTTCRIAEEIAKATA